MTIATATMVSAAATTPHISSMVFNDFAPPFSENSES